MAAQRPLNDQTTTITLPASHASQQSNHDTETTPLLRAKADAASLESHVVHWRNIEDGKKFWLLFLSLIFGSTIAFFDSTLMASAHPVITSYFNASNEASWLSTVFYLTSTVSQPFYGRISDTIGRKPMLILPALLFFLSTLGCGLAPDMKSFIAARGVAGLGAGGLMSVSAVIISDIVKIEYRGIYQSYYNMAFGFGNGLGAALGGWLCDSLGWRAAFYVQLPFIAIFIILCFMYCPTRLGPDLQHREGKTVAEAFKTFDATGAVVLTITVTCLILGINVGGNILPWAHPLVIASLIIAVSGCCALPIVSRRATRPMLPLNLLTVRPTSNLMWSTFIFSLCNNAVLFNVPLYLQAVRQTTPTTSGLYMISPLAGSSVTAISTGYFITWSRRMKPTLALGAILVLMGTIATVCLNESLPLWVVLVLIPWTAIGSGFYFPTASIATLAINAEGEQAAVVTTAGLFRSLGAIHGVAISSWILQNALPIYLKKNVTGKTQEEKQKVIKLVRKSVKAIRRLSSEHKAEAIKAYVQSLRWTFAALVIFAVVAMFIILPVKIPKLQTQDDKDHQEEEEALTDDDSMEDGDNSNADEEVAERPNLLTRQTSFAHSLQLGRRVSHDTTL